HLPKKLGDLGARGQSRGRRRRRRRIWIHVEGGCHGCPEARYARCCNDNMDRAGVKDSIPASRKSPRQGRRRFAGRNGNEPGEGKKEATRGGTRVAGVGGLELSGGILAGGRALAPAVPR